MKRFRLALLLITSILVDGAAAGPTEPPRRSHARDWYDRPWEVRYILFFASVNAFDDGAKIIGKINHAPQKPGRELVYFLAGELFAPTATFQVPRAEPIAMVAITFDRNGHVADRGTKLSAFTAKISFLDAIVLTEGGSRLKKPYELADWTQGIPGDVSFSPAVCNVTSDVTRYEANWDQDDTYRGSFGCREWTAQLYDRDRPYIDVTSYPKYGSFIGEFVGWSRFTDPRKPVIGKQGKTWLCFYDCPTGEAPGVIVDIESWAAKHHFPMPVPPPRQPMYPNANYKDDLMD